MLVEAIVLRGRVLFTALLTLVFCVTAVFPVAAVPPSAKDLVLAAVNNFDLGMNEGFYKKSTGEGTLEVTRFEGSLKETVGDYTGAALRYSAQMDDSRNAIKISYDLNAKDIVRAGDIYLYEDKLILTKDFFLLLQDFGVDVFQDSGVSLEEVPAYLYLADPQLETTWEQLADYQEGKLPAEFTELLAFFVKAVPDECFRLSPTKVTMEIDQDGLVDTIVNLLTNVKNESEWVAETLLGANEYTFEQMGMDPEEAKREMAAQLRNMTVPSREEVAAVMSLVEVRDFSFEYSLLPGGPKNFNMDLGFAAPDGSISGSLAFAVDAAGMKDDLKGTYRLAAGFSAADGPNIAVVYDGAYNYTDTVAIAKGSIDVTAKDNATGELLLDLGLADSSVTEVDPDLVLSVPELTAKNSLDISELIPAGGVTIEEVNRETEFIRDVVVNGVTIEGKSKMGKDGQIVVPARAVLEQMGYQVEWVSPDKLRVISDPWEFTLFMNKNTYLVGDLEKELYSPPYLEAGKALIPLGFLASEEVGAVIDLSDSLVITNQL